MIRRLSLSFIFLDLLHYWSAVSHWWPECSCHGTVQVLPGVFGIVYVCWNANKICLNCKALKAECIYIKHWKSSQDLCWLDGLASEPLLLLPSLSTGCSRRYFCSYGGLLKYYSACRHTSENYIVLVDICIHPLFQHQNSCGSVVKVFRSLLARLFLH